MSEMTVGVRELKAQLSKYLRQVKAGQTVVITEHGKVVAQLRPAGAATVEDKVWAMVDAGLADWNGERLPPMQPVATLKAGHSVAQLLVDDRR